MHRISMLGVAIALAAAAACSSQSGNPAAPAVSTGSGSTAAAADGTTLKVAAPANLTPANRAVTSDRKPSLSAENVRALYGQGTFQYRFELYEGNTLIQTALAAQGSSRTTYTVSEDLKSDTLYRWRTRAELAGAFGPWSTTADFLTPGLPATLTAISPNAGSVNGGTAITLTGTNFGQGATVSLGGTAATAVVVSSATRITATTAARAAGTVDVVVVSGSQTLTLRGAFTYQAATTPPPTGGGSSGPVGPNRSISVGQALDLIVGYHNGIRADLGSNSSRDYRVAFLWAAVANVHYGHPVWNPQGGDSGWCVKDAGGGRPPSDDVIVDCRTRDAWDLIGGAGANGYNFHLDYVGRLPSEQNVYPPPPSSLPRSAQ